jgi:hypothetical protein
LPTTVLNSKMPSGAGDATSEKPPREVSSVAVPLRAMTVLRTV